MSATVSIAVLAALAGASAGIVLARLVFTVLGRSDRDEREHYRAIADDASDIIVVHENNRIVFTSAAMKRLLEREPSDFESGRYLDIVHPDDLAEARKLLGQPLPGESRRATYRVRHRNGSYVWFEVSTRAVYNTAGEFVREISVGRDVNERKRQEAEIVAAQEHAEAANRAKSLFLSTMSHELRTPLNAVIGFSEILAKQMLGSMGNNRYAEYAESIHSSGRHLLDVINDILDMTRLDTDQLTLQIVPTDLGEVIQDCLDYVAPLARAAQVEVRAEVGTLSVTADPTRLRQIIFNLLSNAIKFTGKGGHVTIEATAAHDAALITVTDTGIGMKPEDFAVALAPFGQIDDALSRSHEGVGLGLPLSKRLVELHGGTLCIESVEGAGTTVRVTIPGCHALEVRGAA